VRTECQSPAVHVVFVAEYGAAGRDGMTESLMDAIQELRPEWRITSLHGFLRTYRPGGLRPARLLNLIYLYLRVVVFLIVRCPDVIVAATTPPFLQIWAALLGSMFKTKVVVWLLDYHPEMEARWLERHRLGWIATLLRRIDRIALKGTCLVVGLDDAMVDAVRERCPGVAAVAHPTWNLAAEGFAMQDSDDVPASELRLAYIGNLGIPHDLHALERFCRTAAKTRRVRLLAVGCSVAGTSRLGRLCQAAGCEFSTLPRCTQQAVASHVESFKPHFGIVLLRDDYAGLASPSKFMAYLRLGHPLLYIGPRGTNADIVCRRFGGGLAVTNTVSSEDVSTACFELADPRRFAELRAGVRDALAYFAGKDQHTLAQLLVEHLLDR